MSQAPFLTLDLPDPDATAALARRIAPALAEGDTLLLSGEIGAGKTAFARAAIQSRLEAAGLMEDVPSPTYTLVQTYWDGATEIWHADLYRLTGPGGCVELGLEEAFASAITFVEWPDRLGDMRPERALELAFSPTRDGLGRRVTFTGSPDWAARLAPLTAIAEAARVG